MKTVKKMYSENGKTRVLVIDDHQLFREGLSLLLASRPGIEVVGKSASGPDAIALAKETRPDILLLDLEPAPWRSGNPLAAVLDSLPDVRVIIMSSCSDERILRNALEQGAFGVICKISAFTEVEAAIHHVSEGHRYLSPNLADLVFDLFAENGADCVAERDGEREDERVADRVTGAASDSSRKET